MDLISALNTMADGMTASNAGRWQVAGVEHWRGLISVEQGLAYDAGRSPGGISPERHARPGRHDGWTHYAHLIVTQMQSRCAWGERAAIEARETAEDLDRARTAPTLTGSADPGTAAILADRAAQMREKADRHEAWAAAAAECASFGTQLIRRADDIHGPVGAAYASAGRGWAPARKEFLGGA